MKRTYIFYLFRPVNFYGCKSVKLLTTSVPYIGEGGGELLLYTVFMFKCIH